MQHEVAGRHAQHAGAGDVGGHQVGRRLDAMELEAEQLAERAHRQRLGQAGHAFDERVPAADDGQQQLPDRLVLSDDGLGELAPRVRGDFGQGVRHGTGISGAATSDGWWRRAPGDRRRRLASCSERTTAAPPRAASGPGRGGAGPRQQRGSDRATARRGPRRCRASARVVGVGRQARHGDQPAPQVRQRHGHGGRRRAGPLVEPAHRVDELERRRARRIGHGAQRPAAERDGDDRRQADDAELRQRRRQRRARRVGPRRASMAVVVLVPQHAPIERRPDRVDEQLDVAGLVDGRVGGRQRRGPVDDAALADAGRRPPRRRACRRRSWCTAAAARPAPPRWSMRIGRGAERERAGGTALGRGRRATPATGAVLQRRQPGGASATRTTPPASTKRVSAATSRSDGGCCGAISTRTSVAGFGIEADQRIERPLHDVAEPAQQQEAGLGAGRAARQAGATHADALVGRRDHRRDTRDDAASPPRRRGRRLDRGSAWASHPRSYQGGARRPGRRRGRLGAAVPGAFEQPRDERHRGLTAIGGGRAAAGIRAASAPRRWSTRRLRRAGAARRGRRSGRPRARRRRRPRRGRAPPTSARRRGRRPRAGRAASRSRADAPRSRRHVSHASSTKAMRRGGPDRVAQDRQPRAAARAGHQAASRGASGLTRSTKRHQASVALPAAELRRREHLGQRAAQVRSAATHRRGSGARPRCAAPRSWRQHRRGHRATTPGDVGAEGVGDRRRRTQ